MAGLLNTQTKVNADVGSTCFAFREAFDKLQRLRHFCLIHPDPDFIALGFTEAETTQIKSAMADADTIYQAAIGNGTIPAATNLMANIDQLAGDFLP